MPKQSLRHAWPTLESSLGRSKTNYHDVEVTGLMLEVRGPRRQNRTWYLRYRYNGRQHQRRLGKGDHMDYDQACEAAEQILETIAAGRDPSMADATPPTTFRDFAINAYLQHVMLSKVSWKTDESLIRNHLIPHFGDKPLAAITRQDIADLARKRLEEKAAPGSVDRLLVLLRYQFNLAIRWGTPGVDENPAKLVPLLRKDNRRDRYLSQEEMDRLFRELEKSEAPVLRYIVAFLLLTGARKNEVLQARWEDFDFETGLWRIPLTKRQERRFVPLSDGAMALLSEVPRYPHVPWVFPNPATERPFRQIYYGWDTVRRRAGLPDVRIHDLRHSFASMLINAGRSLYEVQQLLGHTQIKTTQRYAHLAPDTLRAATSTAAQVMSDVLASMKKPAHENRALVQS
ncbi:Tyrosine recombinase XerC [Thiorhodovibrio litoralis]|nr:Tyrosine recombinase XerC [Thiorhodovibrio litoralis]